MTLIGYYGLWIKSVPRYHHSVGHISLLPPSSHVSLPATNWLPSVGSLRHFKESSKPSGAGTRCLDCSVEASCPYSAKKLYLTGPRGILGGNKGWPNHIIADDPTPESVTTALQTGPYGR
jgi:hypothetical protein